MKSEVILLKNIPYEGPGLIETLLREKGLRYRIIEVDENIEGISIADISALIVMGGPASANDQSHEMLTELKLIKAIVENGIPYLGICLGLQTLVKALRGQVVKCIEKEIGFKSPHNEYYSVTRTSPGETDSLLEGVPNSFKVFQLHGETVVPNGNMKVLGSGNICPNQIVKAGDKAYGLQFHPELTDELLNDWMKLDTDLRLSDAEILRYEFKNYLNEAQPAGRKILENFIAMIKA